MTETEHLQSAWTQYECEHDHMPASARAVAEWAVSRGLVVLPKIDPLDVLAGQVSRALRQEYGTDPRGRRFRKNHAMRVSKNGVQYTMWGVMGFAPHAHMEMAFTQRREQIVGDCYQLKVDVDVYNDTNPNQTRIQLELDFTEDVAERAVSSDDENYDD